MRMRTSSETEACTVTRESKSLNSIQSSKYNIFERLCMSLKGTMQDDQPQAEVVLLQLADSLEEILLELSNCLKENAKYYFVKGLKQKSYAKVCAI